MIACDAETAIKDSVEIENINMDASEYSKPPFTREQLDSLDKGCRCLLLMWYDPDDGSLLFVTGGEHAFRVLDGVGDNYLESEQFAYQKGVVEAINQNIYTYNMVYTSDMRAMPSFNERGVVIKEGRPLIMGDKDVCVVHERFLEDNNLSVGDTISVELGDKLMHQDAKAFNSNMLSRFIRTEKLEIIGSYSITGMTEASYSPNVIFLPSGLLPVAVPENYEPFPEEFSIFVCDAYDIEKFRNAAEVLFEKSDLALNISDGGWMSVKDGLENGLKVSLLTTVLYVAGALMALVLAVYLYIGKNKKTYAIMRTLGVSCRLARKQIVLPFAVLTAVAAPVGGIAGIVYALLTVKIVPDASGGNASSGFVPDRTLPAGAVIMCLLIELAVVLAASFYMLRNMRLMPPLELLHEGTAKVKKKNKAASDIPAASESVQGPLAFDISKITADRDTGQSGKYGVLRHTAAYIFRHMRRDIGKTSLSLVLVIVMTAGIGMFVLAKSSYNDAFRSVEVRGKAKEFPSDSIARLSESKMLEDFYCHGRFTVVVNGMQIYIPLTVTNDMERYLGDKNTVTYVAGYNCSSLEATGQVCLIGQGLAEQLGIMPGDGIDIMSDSLYSALIQRNKSDMIQSLSVNYKVIGVVESQDEDVANAILTGITCGAQDVYGQPFPMGYCEFKLADNEMLDEANELLEKEKKTGYKYSAMAYYHIDSYALKNIGRVRDLMEVLFPAAVLAVMLIGLFGPFLIIIQSAKEAAFLRVLGVSKMRTRSMMALEQIVICIIGIVITAGGIALSKPDLFWGSLRTLAVCCGLYMAAFVCGALAASVYVTGHGILKLLQVKE